MKKTAAVVIGLLLSFSFFAQNRSGENQSAQKELQTSESKTSTVTIENAQKTEYTKDKETDTEIIVLKGGVVLSVVSGDKH